MSTSAWARWLIATSCSCGVRPSGGISVMVRCVCAWRPATRTMKNSSRFEKKMPEELQPLEERDLGRARLGEHAGVELEPGELAVQVVRWVVVEDERGRRAARDSHRHGGGRGVTRWGSSRWGPGGGRRPAQGRDEAWSSGAAAGRPYPRWELARWTWRRILAQAAVGSLQDWCSARPPARPQPRPGRLSLFLQPHEEEGPGHEAQAGLGDGEREPRRRGGGSSPASGGGRGACARGGGLRRRRASRPRRPGRG